MTETQTRFFKPEDTTPRVVKWPSAMVIAAVPGTLAPVMILVGVADDAALGAPLDRLLRHARPHFPADECRTPEDPTLAMWPVYIVYDGIEGRGAPVTRVEVVWRNDVPRVLGSSHPTHIEEEWIIAQVVRAGIKP